MFPYPITLRTLSIPQSLVIIAGQDSLGRDLRGAEGSKEELGEDLPGNSFSDRTWRPEALEISHPPNPNYSTAGCSVKSVPPRSLSKQYNQLCTTHKRLVKSGTVKCSVSLSDTPPKLNLPSAPSSPAQISPLQEGSVHWGAIGEFSGVQTPDDSFAESRVSVITPVPPTLPPRYSPAVRQAPPSPPPRSLPTSPRLLPSPSLLQGITTLLQEIQSIPEETSLEDILPHPVSGSTHNQETPKVSRPGAVARRISSTDPGILQNRKIPIVSTSVSSLDSFQSEVFLPRQRGPNPKQLLLQDTTMETFQQEAKALLNIRRSLVREMDEFLEEDVCASRIPVLERDLGEIKRMKNAYQDGVQDFLDQYTDLVDDPSVLDRWKTDVIEIGNDVKNHAKKIRDRREVLFPSVQLSVNEQRSLEIQEATLKLQELTLDEKKRSNSVKVQQKLNEDKILAETEGNTFFGECSVFGDMMPDENWEVVENEVVSHGMRNLGKWQEQWNQIERSYRKYENMAVKHNFSEVDREAVKATYEDNRERFEVTRKALIKEDSDVRGLYTLEPTRSDIMKYPVFSGAYSEDYLKFKETMELRFRENKVKKMEQVSKLRECLKGAALERVPDGVKEIEEAFRRLNEAFGNPSKVMAFNLKALEDLGTLPSEKLPNGQFSYAKRIEWLLKLEVIIGKILDLSQRNSKLAHEAFSSSTYKKLWARFPTNVLDKLVKVPGEDAVRLGGILQKIVKMREHSQVMDDECGSSTVASARKKGDPPLKVTAEIFFKTAQNYDECRVCVHLSATGQNHPDLFVNHLSNYATGCPKFIEASSELRKTIAIKIKLCRQCFHPDVIFTSDHIRDCSFSNKKNSYSCQNKNCKVHMWICLTHKQENKQVMERFKRDLQSKGHNLAFTSDMSLQVNQTNTQKLTQAVRKIRRVEKKRGGEVVPVPTGEPLFLFHATQGKKEPVKTFYDSGCSHAVFKDGIPGEQLRGQLVAKGPFNIDGVGGLSTLALDEWVVSVPRTDGKKQLIQGLTVPKITSDFPFTNLDTAVKDIKNDNPSNKILQNCRVPSIAGGSVDMLLGIKFLSVFPKEVHTLPCGLTIYQSRLASHGGLYDSCLGGPHSSFTALAGTAGGTARLLAHFLDGLKVYRQWGPPRISTMIMTEEEIALAKRYNAEEGEMVELSELMKVEDAEADILETDNVENHFTCCIHCPSHSTVLIASDERTRDFKRFQEIHESGLEVEYRCPKCRECLDCKTADKTEKISLREESEMYAIKESVNLDFDKGKIQCSLPLRGRERDFLTSNRDRALKVLQQQCKKYYGDAENKQVILEAFAKLFNNGHARLISQLSQDELDQFKDKEVQHNFVWRVVFSGSLTTPCRPVMDASSRTAFRKDGSGGKCLNDLVCKGKVETLNMVKVLMRFITGRFAVAGDLTQFYNSCKLNPDQWNLQRFLWIEELDPDGEVLEAVITTLMYGVSSVSAQSEYAMSELAAYISEEDPELALFLILSRYVDDLLDSKISQEKCFKLAKSADELFALVGLKCKGWTFSGVPPSPKVSKDGLSVGVFGVFSWFSEGDILEQKFSRLHFGKPKRGKMPNTVKFFEGNSEEDMDKFVPDPLSRRQATSKVASLWDLLGKLTPIMPGLKLDLRETHQRTEGWDNAMPNDLRKKWVKNFWLVEQLRGLKFTRAVMPADAVDAKLRVLTGVDAAKEALVMGCWAGFKLKNGSWSNQLILGRCLLAKNESIPKSELDALCGGSNMAWVVRLALQEWIDTEVVFSDSMIALCWLTSEKLRLLLFHRNRVLQVRRGTDLENVYHVRTEFNPADCGTRPAKVKLSDVGPDSRWENGDPWMLLDITEAVSKGFIKPASELRVSKEMENEFNEGLVFGDRDELLTRGHTVQTVNIVSEIRVRKIQERAEFSNYLLLPTKYRFPATVRIYGYVLSFVKNARKGRKLLGELLREAKVWFSVFSTDLSSAKCNSVKILSNVNQEASMNSMTSVLKHFTIKKLMTNNTEIQRDCILTDGCLHLALLYLFRKGTKEVRQFVSKKFISKIACEVDGILLSKGRLIDGMNFVETGELGNFNLGSLGVKVNIPVLERFSPLSYSIAQHVHWTVGRHRGIETNNRLSLEHVSIIQGMTLYRELAEECIKCHMKRKKFVEVPMGPIAQEQLMIAPPFYITMVDLFGPVKSYVPGYERETRNRPALESKLHIMAAVCVTTKIVNLQVLDDKSAASIIDGFTRLCCEVGIPSMVHVDQDSGALAGFQSVELDFRDLQHKLWTQYGISFTTCPVGGHDQHGLVERVIKSIQETFDDYGLRNSRMHSTGWQTFCKLAENAYNNLPIGYSYSRYQDNTELLKILTPNMLRVGRINSRALQGPIKLPVNKKELMEQVEKTYQGWFRIFKETVVPRLINQPKWFKIERDLKEKDLVYFQKKDSPLSSTWTVGQVDQVIASRDGYIRRAVIKYFNAGENHPHFTDRSVRKLVKLWSMDEVCLFDDLSELQQRLDKVDDSRDQANDQVAQDDLAAVAGSGPATTVDVSGVEGFHCYGASVNLARDVLVASSCSPLLTSVAGHYCGSAQPGFSVGPVCVTLDGSQLDLAAMTISCDLTPLGVHQPGPVGDVEEVSDDDDQEEQPVNFDTLYDVMVSTGFALD